MIENDESYTRLQRVRQLFWPTKEKTEEHTDAGDAPLFKAEVEIGSINPKWRRHRWPSGRSEWEAEGYRLYGANDARKMLREASGIGALVVAGRGRWNEDAWAEYLSSGNPVLKGGAIPGFHDDREKIGHAEAAADRFVGRWGFLSLSAPTGPVVTELAELGSAYQATKLEGKLNRLSSQEDIQGRREVRSLLRISTRIGSIWSSGLDTGWIQSAANEIAKQGHIRPHVTSSRTWTVTATSLLGFLWLHVVDEWQRASPDPNSCAEPGCIQPVRTPLSRYCDEHSTGAAKVRRHRRSREAPQPPDTEDIDD